VLERRSQPAALGSEILSGQVDRVSRHEPSGTQQAGVRRSDRNCRRSNRDGSTTLRDAEIRRQFDRMESQPAPRPENPARRSQHGELSAKSTHHINVHDRVNRTVADRELLTGGEHCECSRIDAVTADPLQSSGGTFHDRVGTDH